MDRSFWPRLVPNWLSQSINRQLFQGATFGLINVELGSSANPEVEQAILDEVGSYGRQLGRIGDALEILLRHVDHTKLNDAERKVLQACEDQLTHVRLVKQRELRKDR